VTTDLPTGATQATPDTSAVPGAAAGATVEVAAAHLEGLQRQVQYYSDELKVSMGQLEVKKASERRMLVWRNALKFPMFYLLCVKGIISPWLRLGICCSFQLYSRMTSAWENSDSACFRLVDATCSHFGAARPQLSISHSRRLARERACSHDLYRDISLPLRLRNGDGSIGVTTQHLGQSRSKLH
jgi:hypothetical protein